MSTAATTTAPEIVQATARYVRMSARKGRLVADLVRGKPVAEAQAILAYSTRAAAVPMRKTAPVGHRQRRPQPRPRRARSRREAGDGRRGPHDPRFRPRAKGRATRINKRTCHITIGIAETERV